MSNNPTPEQRKVLENKSKELVISASAGTGKTTTLVEYIVQLIKNNISPSRLLVVTFTNNAASEMRERVIKKMMASDQDLTDKIDEMMNADISTIHSFLQKLIKKHIDKIEIATGYRILDDNLSEGLKNRAFKNSVKIAGEKEEFQKLLLTVNKEEDLLKEIVFALQNHFAVQPNPKEKFDYYINNQEKICFEADKFLSCDMAERVEFIADYMRKGFLTINEGDKNYSYIENYIRELARINKNDTFKNNLYNLQNLNLKKIKDSSIAPEEVKFARYCKGKLDKIYEEWDLEDENQFIKNPLIEDVYRFYDIYSNELEKIKKDENAVDYNDLEKFADKLLEIPDVLQEIQSNYDYVFIDEYQDTNPVQERLMKLISKDAKFIAVGDPKQGIYGFRNATSEIMKNDIVRLGANGVCYLKENFRSEKQILHFANDVFSKIMKNENTGINYKTTSEFSNIGPYKNDGFVNIDVILPKKEDTGKYETGLYDVLQAELSLSDKCEREAQVITRRVLDLMTKKIKDGDKERNINFSDITILVRKRGALVSKIEENFARCKIPVITTMEKEISSNEEIEVLKNLIKLCIDEKDDISLVSVLSSKLFGMPLEEILLLRRSNLDKSFYEIFTESDCSKEFFEEFNKFKLYAYSKGISFAFKKLLSEKDFYSYVLYKEDGINKLNQVKKFIEIIEKSNYNFDFASLLIYLNSKNIKTKGCDASANAVTISTMHASKGLEYPICIIAGLGDKITKKTPNANASKYAINNELGLGMMYYNFESDEKTHNVVLKAIQLMKSRKEFIDEMMLLYVAITRAKKYLYIVGEKTLQKDEVEKNIEEAGDVFFSKSCMDLILRSIDESKYNITTYTEFDDEIKSEKKLLSQVDTDMVNKIDKYLNYKYPNETATKLRYKNSVTALNKIEDGNISKIGGGKNIDIGIAYHKAMEILNFEKTNSVEDVKNQLQNEDFGDIELDYNLLLNNINLIREIIKDKKIFKEKEFTMKIKASEILENDCEDEVMIQGIIDLFGIGSEGVLIDYKYTNEKNSEKIKEKYSKQLNLYKKAIEKSFNIRLNKIFLLSLKYGQIIEF